MRSGNKIREYERKGWETRVKREKQGETEEKIYSEEAKGAQEPEVYKPMTHDRFYFSIFIV